tara:strand:+ start:749 stop:1171 length:423 start_codon:yes stop_codon:yes gene_type:complete
LNYDAATVMARDLRAFANFLELRGHLLPDEVKIRPYSWVWGWDGQDVPETMASAAKAGLGKADAVKKDYSNSTMNLELVFGNLVFTIHCERDKVCVKRVVGTKTITKQVAVGGYENKEVEEEVIEWDCHPLLAPVKNSVE